jgi:hypothetical protein
MGIPSGKLFLAVIDPIMSVIRLADFLIRLQLIGHQMRSTVHKLCDLRHQISNLVAVHQSGPNRAVALNGNQHSLLLSPSTTLVLEAVLIAGFAADILFIQFNDTTKCRQQLQSWIHHFSDCMSKFPSALLRDANPFGQKYRGDTFAGIYHIVHGQEPLPKRQFCAVHRSVVGHRELPLALGTFVEPGSYAFS